LTHKFLGTQKNFKKKLFCLFVSNFCNNKMTDVKDNNDIILQEFLEQHDMVELFAGLKDMILRPKDLKNCKQNEKDNILDQLNVVYKVKIGPCIRLRKYMDNEEEKHSNIQQIAPISGDVKATYKLCLIGEPMCGKTTFLNNVEGKDFSSQTARTVGYFHIIKDFMVNNVRIKANIWDVAGQEKFQKGKGRVHDIAFKDVDVILFVFDMHSIQTLKKLPKWRDWVQQVNDNKIRWYYIGNQRDNTNIDIKSELTALQIEWSNYIKINAKTDQVDVQFTKILAETYAYKQKWFWQKD